ncbi:MAG: hypothetical protein H6719_15890 [Sandaracinaceae bacterium]|nr:hypothetical protein [Sandaracinaceae bacterium]
MPPPPPPARKAKASIPPPPPPRARLAKVIEVIGTKVDTLVGFELTKLRIGAPTDGSLHEQPPLGPNPFGPPTAEVDLAPYLRKAPIDMPPRVVAIAVVAICFVLGSGLAVAAMGGASPVRAMKYDAKPPAFAANAEPAPIAQPRLTELLAVDEDEAAPSARAVEPSRARAVEAAPTAAPTDDAASRVAQLRARRQARRRARIRSRWLARQR